MNYCRGAKPSYLLKTIHSIYNALDEEERKQIYVILNNVDVNPDAYREANSLAKYVLLHLFYLIIF